MRAILHILTGAALAIAAASAVAAPPPAERAELDSLFVGAREAYDAGRLDDAVARYEEILRRGYRLPEVDYNLANALFRRGDVGRAALHYRRAQYAAPRDPDIRGNLEFAWRTAGAPAPQRPLWMRPFARMRRSECAALAVGGYWTAAVLLGALMAARRGRPALQRAAVAALAAMAFGLGGLAAWSSLERRPELVVLRPGVVALFAPLDDATPHFEAPPGTVVRLEASEGGWARVSLGRQSGWIPASAAGRVGPNPGLVRDAR